MEVDFRERNSDCVYFLASPLACKKGIVCEYRHSAIARLNPKDCCYWLAGNCLIPSCRFRHPPLDKDADIRSSLPHGASAASKMNVPCYFYFNGFCKRGERCYFLHGPHSNAVCVEDVKISPAIADKELLSNRLSDGKGTYSAPEASHHNPYNTAPRAAVDADVRPKDNSIKNAVNRNSSCQSHCQDAGLLDPNFLMQADGLTPRRPHLWTDQISEEAMENLWDSSPGFDALGDGKSGNFDYGEDREYLLAIDSEQRELYSQFLRYNFEGLVKHDPVNHAAELKCGGIYDSFSYVDDELSFNDVGKDPNCPKYEILDLKLFSAEFGFNRRRGLDLRDHLKMCRVIERRSGRRHDSSFLPKKDQDRPERCGTRQRVRARLASKVVMHDSGSQGANAYLCSAARCLESSRSRQQGKENKLAKRPFLSSDHIGRPAARERRCNRASTTFTGPKTLAQNKKEKNKVGKLCILIEPHQLTLRALHP